MSKDCSNKEFINNLYNKVNENELNYDVFKIKKEASNFLSELYLTLFDNYINNKKDNFKSFKKIFLKSKKLLISFLNELNIEVCDIVEKFYLELSALYDLLKLDLNAIYEGDPSCNSINEIIAVFPGFRAIFTYRIAHFFYINDLKLVARVLSECAHTKTGIDINPGAKIGKSFFIDHGTGIVIGETSIIGDNVKLYQGVTLGALSLEDGHKLKNIKRHPTIKNNVTIYANATILGGDTIIGNNCIIGGNVFLTSSIQDNSIVKMIPCGVSIKENK